MSKSFINFKNPKTKDMIITILEVLLVAGIIFGALMFIYNKVNKEADITSGTVKKTEKKSKDASKYLISVNKSKNVLVVYKTSKNMSNRTAVKTFKCSVGSKVKLGNYKTKSTYSWILASKRWHQYNTAYSANSYIWSPSYKDKYPNTLDYKSFNKVGLKQAKDANIVLYAGDASWLKKHCGHGVAMEIVKGHKNDALKQPESKIPALKKPCGFDPTDTVKFNPYRKVKKNSISTGLKTVYVEKGGSVNYFNNIIALSADGKNITKNLKHSSFETNEVGTFTVKYSYKKALKAKLKFKVIDTTPPKVTIAKKKYQLKLKNLDKKTVLKQSNIDKIKKMVLSNASSNEPGSALSVQTLDKDDLNEGKVSVVVLARDKSDNVGSAQVYVDVKVKVEKVTKYRPSDKARKRALAKLKKKQKAQQKAKKKAQKKKKTKKKTNNIETKKQNETVTQQSE